MTIREDDVTPWKDRFQVFQVRPTDYEVIGRMMVGKSLPDSLYCDTQIRIAMMDAAHTGNEIIKTITGTSDE